MGARDLAVDRDSHDVTPKAALSTRLPEGTRIGRYRLCFEIATGGMATVYLAVVEGSRPGMCVALKRVHPHLASQRAFVEMFLDEARIASRIDHPNVCRMIDFGRADDSHFIAMEYLRGRPLARVMSVLRHLPEAEYGVAVPVVAARIVLDAARGLHAAHELRDSRGELLEVVHRDVSPHNLFVTWDGICQVVDFGIASARDRLHHTETGTVKGKFAYMAPEQMLGARADRRADVWSLGVVLWELLAGRSLFKRKTETETLMAVTQNERPALSFLRPEIPPALEAIVDRALARDPQDRHASANDLANDLSRWLCSQPGPADSAEVAAWMHTLFPGEASNDEALVQRALDRELPVFSIRPTEERSAVVRKSDAPTKAALRIAPIVLYLLALLLAIAVGALVALLPNFLSAHEARNAPPLALAPD
jgi:eukaryotic-like serine/threonine-protein kinase